VRPLELRLRGFGAFPDAEVVDLAELSRLGLFLVSGPTGAGKTTLLDAMAFALYGGLPAGRPTSEVRSHHVGPDEPCEVELTFVVDDGTFRVRRTPERVRPKRRGSGTTVDAATAELHRVADDGSTEPVASGTRDVTARCAELVGLDPGQFERVVLLPQGRFQRFLLADTADRRPLLQRLFGTDLYRRAVDELKRRAQELGREVARVDAEVARHRLNAREHLRGVASGLVDAELGELDPDDDVELLAALWEKLASAVDEVCHDAEQLSVAAAEATGTARAAAEVVARWDRREALQAQLDELLARRADVDALAARVVEAERAAPVVAAADAAARAEVARRRAASGLADVGRELRRALAAAGLAVGGQEGHGDGADTVDVDEADRALARATTVLERTVAGVRALHDAREALDRAERRRAELEAAEVALRDEHDRVALEQDQLAERVAQLQPRADAAPATAVLVEEAERRLTARRRLERARARHGRDDDAHRRAEATLAAVVADFVSGAAPRLAATLREGEACPVCGGVEHPAPAAGEGADVDAAALEAAQQVAAAAASAVASAAAEADELSDQLGPDADRSLDELEAAHAELVGSAREAAGAAAELQRARAALDAARTRLSALALDATRRSADRARADDALAAARDRVEELLGEVGEPDPEALARRGDALAAGSRAVTAYRGAASSLALAEGAAAAAATALRELGGDAPPDVEAARRAAMSESERGDAQRRVARHATALSEARGGLEALDGAEIPDERPDAEAATARADELQRRARAEAARAERLLERGERAQEAIAAARRTDDAAAGLRDVHERTERVAALCDGQGPGRISLEAWVLAGELERVTAAANVHLARMSNGRYQLQRTDDAGHRAKQAGLDLAVLDSHTGRARPPATLSGGEQFQASLALALGLADVVSLGGTGSGRRFEALFVDEGFGSLDPDALDQAVEALHQIHAGGRMVGVVTHVEAMKQQLPIGVEVHRRPDGRGSTLRAPAAG